MDVTGARVEHNLARGNDGDGFAFEDLDGAIIRADKSVDNRDDGFDLCSSTGGVMSGNVAISNDEDGLESDADGARLRSNLAISNGLKGFRITADRNVLGRNKALRNEGDGFFVSDEPEDTTFIGNLSLKNGDNGFAEEETGKGTSTYRKNISIRNTNYGIFAPNGVASSAFNLVFGNGMGCSAGLICGPQS